jgi:clan AA aspartic protease (TIGR02281 family)
MTTKMMTSAVALLGGVVLSGVVASPASAQLLPAVAITIGWPEILAAGVVYCIATDCLGVNTAQAAPQPGGKGGNGLTIKVGGYNQCETEFVADGHSFRGLLDSGASGHVVFGRNQAKALLGSEAAGRLSYNDGTYSSANGIGHYSRVTLKELRIGNWSIHDVPAEINQAEMDEPLIGLEILHALQFQVSGGYCHLSLPQSLVVVASVHHAPSAPVASAVQPAAPMVSRHDRDEQTRLAIRRNYCRLTGQGENC